MVGLVGSDRGGCWAGWAGPATLEQATASRPAAMAGSHSFTALPNSALPNSALPSF